MSETPKNGFYATSKTPCPICNSKKLNVFFETYNVPVHCNLLWTSRDSALACPKGDIELALCPVCGFITNLAFTPALMEYDQEYQNPLSFSPRFRKYAKSQAERLIKRYDLYDKDILDIGCGQGDFLQILCELGHNRGVGFDPSAIKREIDESLRDRVLFIKDYYSERYSAYHGDLVVCRHTLEHIPDPKTFLTMLHRVLDNRQKTYVFCEVPNAQKTLQELFIWDIIYEHCSYFTRASLSFVFSACGFHVLALTDRYEGQFLCIDAQPTKKHRAILNLKNQKEVNQISNEIRLFSTRYQNKIKTCTRKLEQLAKEKRRVVIWGAGSKGVTFLNTIQASDLIKYAVDLNPRKQGKFVPGTGQQIVTPEFLQGYKPDVVIIMNPIYAHEIRNLVTCLGLNTQFIYV